MTNLHDDEFSHIVSVAFFSRPTCLFVFASCMFAFGRVLVWVVRGLGMTFVSFSLVLAGVIDHDACLTMELRLQERKGGVGSSRGKDPVRRSLSF